MVLQFRKFICFSLILSFSILSPAQILCETISSEEAVREIPLEEVQSTEQTISVEEAEQLNELFAAWRSQLNELLSNVQHLSQLIATQKLSPSDPNGAYEWLQQMSMLIGKLNNTPYSPLSSNKLVHLFNFNKTLIKAVKDAVNNNLNTRASVSILEQAFKTLEATIKKRSVTPLPLPAAAAYAFETNKLMSNLSIKVGHGGLNWFNRTYRTVSEVNSNLHITSTIVALGITAVVASWIIAMIPEKHFYNKDQDPKNDNFLKQWKRSLQERDIDLDPEKPRTQAWGNIISNFGYGIAGAKTLNDGLGITEKLGRWGHSLDAWLRGTQPEMRRDLAYIDDITLEDPMFDCIRDLFDPFYNILKFLENPDKYINTGMKVPKCILLAGPPGNGKSLSARGLAGSINNLFMELGRFQQFGFITVEPWDFDLADVVERAKQNAPCVLFIDEIHLFGGGAQITSGNSVGLSKLLTELDKIDQNNDPAKQIFVIGATNRPDLTDEALRREGRFKTIHFPVPSFQQRVTVLESLCKKSAVDTTNIDLEHLAALTWGASFSTLNAIFSQAGFLAKQHAEGINADYLYQAVNKVFRKLNTKVDITQNEIDLLAYHYAGIAFAYKELDSYVELEAVTILPHSRDITEQHEFLRQMENQNANDQHKAEYGSYYTWIKDEYIQTTHTEPTVECKLLLSGVMAQQVMSGKKTSYKREDRKAAFEKAKQLLLDGLSLEDLSKDDQNKIKSDALKIIVQCETELTKLFSANKEKIQKIADELKEKQFLTINQINEIL